MIYRSKAPLRLGLAGGGTDVSPYCDEYGGSVLNVTIDMYCYCTLEPTNDGKITFASMDRGEYFQCDSISSIDARGGLLLHKGVYNRIVKDFRNGEPLSFKLHTYSDAPSGSGLGASSTMVVAIIKVFMEWLNLPLGEYDLAHLAYQIERIDLGLSGGKQDQYAATFGGFNFMEFYENDRCIINPLRVKNWIKNELESSLLLYYLGVSRESARIIDEQIKNVTEKQEEPLNAMHELKRTSIVMKEAVLKGDFNSFLECLNIGWMNKKQAATVISNDYIDEVVDYIMGKGCKAAKVSGAGGGGFMILAIDPIDKHMITKALEQFNGSTYSVTFTGGGAQAWTLY